MRHIKGAEKSTTVVWKVEGLADVLIICVGISGLAAAYALAQEGVNVKLLEQHDLASMASGSTLATLCPSDDHANPTKIVQAYARAAALLAFEHRRQVIKL